MGKTLHEFKDMQAVTGNHNYYQLVAMPLANDAYTYGRIYEHGETWLYAKMAWETDPTWVEVDNFKFRDSRVKGLYGKY